MNSNGLEIKIALLQAGINQVWIAGQLGITRQFVGQVVNRLRPTKYVREAISEAVRKPVEELWPNNKRPHRAEGIAHNNFQRKVV